MLKATVVGVFKVAIQLVAAVIGLAALVIAIPGIVLLFVALAVHTASEELGAWARSL